MARYAVIQNGIVTNVIELDPNISWEAPHGAIVVPADAAGFGWKFDGKNLINPNPDQPPVAALSSGGPVVIA